MSEHTHNAINTLIDNINTIHTTPLGIERMKRNLDLKTNDVVNWCMHEIQKPNANIVRKGKNWYVTVDGSVITINAHSFTIITAHKIKNSSKN